MASYSKNKPAAFELAQLQAEINSNSTIVPSCTGTSQLEVNAYITFDFAAVLSGSEETELEAIVAAHVPLEQSVDINQLPLSDIDNVKLAVHTSYKPCIPGGKQTYAVWTGAGDDMVTGNPGEGELLHFDMATGTPTVTKDVKFHSDNGKIWIHEGYLKFTGAGDGDYLSSDVVAEASALQASVNLDLVIEDDWVKYAPGGAGTGTHGFGGTPVLIPRGFSGDGDWDYDGVDMTPNMGGTGGFKISTIERAVHRYINKIPCYGDCTTFFSMSSDETSEIPVGYFVRITVSNVSDSNWHASIIMEIYRERTANP